MASRGGDKPDFSGQPFSAVFQQPGHYPEDQWRIRSSGTHGIPELSKQTAAVVLALDELGIEMQRYWSAKPINPVGESSHTGYLILNSWQAPILQKLPPLPQDGLGCRQLSL